MSRASCSDGRWEGHREKTLGGPGWGGLGGFSREPMAALVWGSLAETKKVSGSHGSRLRRLSRAEEVGGRKAAAGRRWEGHCQGLLWDMCVGGGGQGQGAEKWPGSQGSQEQGDPERSRDFLEALILQGGWMQVPH